MEASEMKRAKELEEENGRLKRMYANLAMELVLQNTYLKKSCKALPKRAFVEEIRKELPKSVSKACRVLGLSRSVLHYKSIKDDSTYVDLLHKHAEDHPREGFWKAYGLLRNQGVVVNHKWLFRIYQEAGMSLCRKCKRRLPNREKQPLSIPASFTQAGLLNFKN